LRGLIDSSGLAIHAFQLASYTKAVLLIGIKYVTDYRHAIESSTGYLEEGVLDKGKAGSLQATWSRYENDLERYFRDRPLGEFRGGDLEKKTVEELRLKLERDIWELKDSVDGLTEEISMQQAVKKGVAEKSPWL
jgi:hypothetical protein